MTQGAELPVPVFIVAKVGGSRTALARRTTTRSDQLFLDALMHFSRVVAYVENFLVVRSQRLHEHHTNRCGLGCRVRRTDCK